MDLPLSQESHVFQVSIHMRSYHNRKNGILNDDCGSQTAGDYRPAI